MKWAVFSKVKLDPLSFCDGRHSIGFLVGQFGNSFSFMGNNKRKAWLCTIDNVSFLNSFGCDVTLMGV
jgi:hypothetical protein